MAPFGLLYDPRSEGFEEATGMGILTSSLVTGDRCHCPSRLHVPRSKGCEWRCELAGPSLVGPPTLRRLCYLTSSRPLTPAADMQVVQWPWGAQGGPTAMPVPGRRADPWSASPEC